MQVEKIKFGVKKENYPIDYTKNLLQSIDYMHKQNVNRLIWSLDENIRNKKKIRDSIKE